MLIYLLLALVTPFSNDAFSNLNAPKVTNKTPRSPLYYLFISFFTVSLTPSIKQ